jgi:hypothetical protein
MDCHDKTIMKAFAKAAHNLPRETLKGLTNGPQNGLAKSDIACASCHREHQGAQFDLTAISDAACQSCHQRVYESFSKNHPDFGRWPYERRSRIAFNHASHRDNHFAEKTQAFDCRSCHMEDATRGEQLLVGYEAACAACHDERIATSVAKGVPFLLLPTLDVAALKAAGHDIGLWPERATGDFDGRLPPAMKLLLAADADAATAIATLGEDFDFFDIDPDDPEQVKAIATLATGIKKLFAELGASERAATSQRLQAALGQQINPTQLQSLFAALPSHLVTTPAKNWFPQREAVNTSAALDHVLSPERPEPQLPGRNSIFSTRQPVAFDPPGAWQVDDETFAIRYTPAAHADPVLAGWLQLLASTPGLQARPLALAMFKELTNVAAPGLCTSCHSIEQHQNGHLTINWRAYDGTSKPRTFTKFSHLPHLHLPQLEDCTSCHAIDSTKISAVSYPNHNPHDFVSDFLSLSKQHCVQCHTAKAAGESCHKCHNYHVDELEAWRLPSISDVGLRIAD